MKKMFDFNRQIIRRGTNSVKYDLCDKIFGNPDVLPLWVADMDFASPEPVLKAMKKRMGHPVLGYTFRNDSYYDAVIQWMKIRHNWDIQRDWISFSPGVVSGLAVAIQAFTQPGDQVIIQTPVYTPFYSVVKDQGRELIFNKLLYKDGKAYIDFKNLEQIISPKTKILILCNPHNPCGRVWTLEELKTLGDFCLRNNILVFSDEIHSDLVFAPVKHVPYASVSEDMALHSISFFSPSKTFNLAGLSTSYLIVPDHLKFNKFQKLTETLHLYNGNIFGNIALEAAYNQCIPWLEELLLYLKGNIDFVTEFLQQQIPVVFPYKTEATYLMWLDFNNLGLQDMDLHHFIIHKAGLGLSKGSDYGPGGEGFMRLNVACPRETLEKALYLLLKALRDAKLQVKENGDKMA